MLTLSTIISLHRDRAGFVLNRKKFFHCGIFRDYWDDCTWWTLSTHFTRIRFGRAAVGWIISLFTSSFSLWLCRLLSVLQFLKRLRRNVSDRWCGRIWTPSTYLLSDNFILVSYVQRIFFCNCAGSFRCFLVKSNLPVTSGLHLALNHLCFHS